MWSPYLPYRFHVSVGTPDTVHLKLCFAYEILTLYDWLSQTIRLHTYLIMSVLTPILFLKSVWPLPISLATTFGISFDFSSSPYLDVSVRAVPLFNLCIQLKIHGSSPWGFPHSEICGSTDISSLPQLIAGNRVLLRLSVPRHSPYALFRLNSLSFSYLE